MINIHIVLDFSNYWEEEFIDGTVVDQRQQQFMAPFQCSCKLCSAFSYRSFLGAGQDNPLATIFSVHTMSSKVLCGRLALAMMNDGAGRWAEKLKMYCEPATWHQC